MKFSVIIPVYNASNMLKDAVSSVFSQTYLDFICEIVIVDDGSTDESFAIMEEIKRTNQTNIPIVLIHKANGGASSARNAGIKAASGDWIALLDADDEWLPQKLERQILVVNENPDIDFLGCQSDNRKFNILFRKIDTLYKVKLKDLCIKNFPVTPSIIFRKSVLNEVGLFDENKKYSEDHDFCLRMCEKANYYHMPESLVITGHGKPAIGHSGLSANVNGMYQGAIVNIKELYDRKAITAKFYALLRLFYFAKHIRRKLLVTFQKNRIS